MSTTRDLTRLILLVLALGISFLLSLTFLRCEAPKSRSMLTGKVEWIAPNGSNRITFVAIGTETGDYLVGDDAKGRELVQFVNRKVSASGRIVEDEKGQKTIYVSKYQLVPQ
jgi:hypothetical protein